MFKNKLNFIVLLLILFISIGSISANEDISDSPSLAVDDDSMDLMTNGGIGPDIDSEPASLSFDDASSSSLSSDESGIEPETPSSLDDSNSDIPEDSDKSFDGIQSLVDSAESGDTILLNGTYTSSGKAINVNKTLTIDGQGETTLDAKQLSGIFIINANDFILKDLKFSNANDSAVIIKGKNNLINNCDFTSNGFSEVESIINEVDRGGAIYGNCTVTNCKFTGNSAYDGGAIYGNCTVTNCKFTGNSAYDGGAIYGNCTVTNCIFKNNYATEGGAIYGKCTITNSTFDKNSAENGGAIYGKCTITNCKFTKNYVIGSGGAIYGGGTVTNCTFTNNSINSDYFSNKDIRGGAIYIKSSNSTIVNCIFKENKAIGSYFDDGSSDVGFGGAIAVESKNCQIKNCKFISNIAGPKKVTFWSEDENYIQIQGGAIYSTAQNLKVTNCSFKYNKAYNGYGGAIYSKSSNSTISNCEFKGNKAGEEGGAIYWKVNNKAIKNCNFTNNTSPREKDIGGRYTIKVTKTGKYAGNFVLTMKVYNAITKKPAKNQNITLLFENSKGKKFYRHAKSNAKGIAKYSVVFPAGKHTVTFYSKYGLMLDAKNKKAKISITLKAYKAKLSASKLTTTYKSGKTFKVKVVNARTKQKPTNVKIALKVYTGKKSKVYYAFTKKGVARFDLSNVSVGRHKVVAYSALKGVKASKIKSKVVIKKPKLKIIAPKVKNKYGNLQDFKVKVISKNTKKPAKYLKLKLIVYTGKKYYVYDDKTDEKGKVYFNTWNLKKGTHKVIIKSGDKNCAFKKESSIVIV